MRSRGPLLAVMIVLPLAAFLAGRQGAAEHARSERIAPTVFAAEGEAPRITALPDAPRPPALARKRKPKSNGGGGDTSAGTVATTTPSTQSGAGVPSTGNTSPPIQQTAPDPGSTPPDLGGRDE